MNFMTYIHQSQLFDPKCISHIVYSFLLWEIINYKICVCMCVHAAYSNGYNSEGILLTVC